LRFALNVIRCAGPHSVLLLPKWSEPKPPHPGLLSGLRQSATTFPNGIVQTLRMTQTTKTITMMVPTSPKPSISFLLPKQHYNQLSSMHEKDRTPRDGVFQGGLTLSSGPARGYRTLDSFRTAIFGHVDRVWSQHQSREKVNEF
jgi:hypothetical protein